MIPGITIVGAGALIVGIATILLAFVRTLWLRQRPALRGTVATGVTGAGIAALGVALLILSTSSLQPVGLMAAFIAGAVGVAHLLMARSIRRLRR